MDNGGVPALGARIASVAETFALGRFRPASVQRDYQWEERHSEELFSDLERAFAADETPREEEADAPVLADEPPDDAAIEFMPEDGVAAAGQQRDYFLGAMVLRPAEPGGYEVFDGLQRLTTLTALIAVLRDLIGADPIAEELETLVTAPEGAHRVFLSDKDATLREEVQKRGEAARSRRSAPPSDMSARIRAACAVFRRELSRWGAERRIAFALFLMHRVRLVTISTSDQILASQIFVTTNARGLPLDQVELFKGQLIDVAKDDETAELIAKTWADVQNAVGDDLEDLLAALDFIERREPQGADLLTRLADHLRRQYGGARIGAWVSRLALLATAWRDLHQRLFDPNDGVAGASIWRLRLFKWREWKPLALIWTAEFARHAEQGGAGLERAKQTFARRFDLLHRRCMAIQLTGNSDLDRMKIFGRAIGQVGRRRDPFDRQGALGFDMFAHARIQETLRLPLVHDDTRLTLVRWAEASLWDERPPRAIARASVEHILPLRPQAGSLWLTEFPNEDVRFNVCHALGNLALTDYRANEGMGNADFAVKLPTLKAQAGKYKLLGDIVAQSNWTAEIIAARTRRLCEHVWSELNLPPPRTPKRAA